MRRALLLVAAFALLPVAPGCGRDTAAPHGAGDPGPTVAVVDGAPITRAELEAAMARRGSRLRRLDPEADPRKAALEDLVRLEVLAANARREGWDRDPEIQEAMTRLLANKYEQEVLAAELAKVAVSEEDALAHYREHPEAYSLPEMARGGILYVRVPPRVSETRRQDLRTRAEDALARATEAGPEGFPAIVAELSDDQATRYRGGDGGWIARTGPGSRWEPAATEALFSLDEPGELAPLVEGTRGFYVVQLLERRPSEPRPFEAVKAAVEQELLRARRDARERELHAALRGRVDVKVYADVLESIELPGDDALAERRPPALPVGP